MKANKVLSREDLCERLEKIIGQAEVLLDHATETGDTRGATDALRQLHVATASLGKVRDGEAGNIEAMDEDEFLDYCFDRFEGRIPLRLLDKVIGKDLREQFTDERCPTCDGFLTKVRAEKVHAKPA